MLLLPLLIQAVTGYFATWHGEMARARHHTALWPALCCCCSEGDHHWRRLAA
jgi:hypothetical protein